jgi:hypothetical protein
MKKISLIILTLTSLNCLTSCEGFKILTLHNVSNEPITVTAKPGFEPFNANNISGFPNKSELDSTTFQLLPDSVTVLLSTFTTFMNGVKIRPQDLRTNYLRIETINDTIIANSKDEILRLAYKNKETKFNRKTDKQLANSRNIRGIFIRE